MNPSSVATVVAYAPQPLVASALSQVVFSSSDIELQAIASTLPELLRVVSSRQPSVVLLTFSASTDLELIPKIQLESPSSAIVLWAHSFPPAWEQEARALGIRGILWRGPSSEKILTCIRRVHRGEFWFEPVPAPALPRSPVLELTEHERELLTLVAQGLNSREIAKVLSTTKTTVKRHMGRLMVKVGVQDRLELTLIGLWHLASRGNLVRPRSS